MPGDLDEFEPDGLIHRPSASRPSSLVLLTTARSMGTYGQRSQCRCEQGNEPNWWDSGVRRRDRTAHRGEVSPKPQAVPPPRVLPTPIRADGAGRLLIGGS